MSYEKVNKLKREKALHIGSVSKSFTYRDITELFIFYIHCCMTKQLIINEFNKQILTLT